MSGQPSKFLTYPFTKSVSRAIEAQNKVQSRLVVVLDGKYRRIWRICHDGGEGVDSLYIEQALI